jgi:hypothetical protein
VLAGGAVVDHGDRREQLAGDLDMLSRQAFDLA